MSQKLTNFRKDEQGNVAMLFAFMMIPLLGGVGLAVDYARAHRLATQLQIVADAATAAGLAEYRRTGNVNKGQQRLLSFIDEGLRKDGMVRAREENGNGANVGGNRVVYVDGSVIDPATSSVRPVLRTTMGTPFMSLLGTEEMDVEVFTKGAVASNTLEGTKDLEVSLMLDVSGSMAWTSSSGTIKIDDMKEAAQDFLDVVMPEDLAVDNRRVGLVPFSERVNVGSYAVAATGLAPTIQVQNGTKTVHVASTTSFSWQTLTNCRNRVKSFTDYASYSNAQAEQFCRTSYSTRVQSNQTQYRTPARVSQQVPNMETRHLRTCVTERPGTERYTDAVAGAGKYVGVHSPGSSLTTQYSTSQNNCSLPEVKTLTTDKQSLKDHIANFGTHGGTAGHTATAWSYYMLSPEWNRFWSEGHTDVAEYDNDNVIKAAVLMTDGVYNSNWVNPSASEQAIAVCNQMKAKGIIVYTIGFDMSTDVNDPARQTLIACASPNKYYFPYDGEALREAFNEIGNSLVTIVTHSSDDNTVLIQE
jgi:Flp pilus assembly protein TadG